jgi:pyruvate/2-oxoglutarate dehydrogenase complex dihydrolipoamide acyltransferase (E2) component
MGATVDKPVVDNGQVVSGRVAPLFLRADHRLVDAYQMRGFLETLAQGFRQPELLDLQDTKMQSAA